MTNIIFSRKEFEKHIKITPEIQEKITMFGTPLENINEEEIEIEVLANRPDLISLDGFIRSFKRFLGKEFGIKEYLIKKPESNFKVYVDKSTKEIRPYVSCAIIKKINFNEVKLRDLINLQEKLATTLGRNRKKAGIGIYPLDKINFPLKYEARDPKEIIFRPLGYDKEINAKDILIMHPTGRKYEHLLKESKKYPIFIDSKKNIISMPPIINSEDSGKIDVKTKDLFIECTGFDKNIVEKTLTIIATSLAEAGGIIHQVEIIGEDNGIFPKLEKQKTKISINNVNKLLGINLNENQMQKLIEKMGHNYKKGIVESPSWRVDILHEVDIIEDIAIAYGYENLVPEMPNISTSGEESKESIVKRKLSEILLGLNMLEISTYHLIKPQEVEDYNLKESLELLDSKNEYKYLRPNLLVPMLRILSENKDSEYPQKLFEIGRIFNKNIQKENGIEERDNLILSIIPANATEIKKHIDYLFKMLNLDYQIKELIKPELIEGRACSIILNNNHIGYFGEIHPNILRSQGINMPLAVAEISLEEIYDLIN
ncbi:MAG: phenylalanine--tRNA ligase subunit beta [Nanoarchaeota archaeon]